MRWREIISEARRSDPREDPEFARWFSGSQIVDRKGAPLVCFHGTDRDFASFERRAESHDTGIYFTPHHDYASGYATRFQNGIVSGANLRACYLAIRNPVFVLTKPTDIELKIGKRGAFTDAVIAHFEALGYDGVVVGVTDYEVEIGARSVADASEICAFHPHQIRSVFEVGQRRLREAVIIRDRAHSDVDGQMRDLAVHLNPGRQETAAVLARSIEGSLRGFVWDRGERLGQVVIWDSYVADHAAVAHLLTMQGHGHPWPRFSFNRSDFEAGRVFAYVDGGMTIEAWQALPKQHLTRMLGQEPKLIAS